MSAFAGGGAGLVQFPVLILFGLPFTTALATHKIATVALGVGASYRHFQERKFTDIPLMVTLAICGTLGSIAGTFVIVQIPDHIAQPTLGIITILLGLYSIIKKDIGQTFDPKNRDLKGLILGGLGLFAIGIFKGSFSSGTGLFVTIWLIHWFGLDYKRSIAYTFMMVGILWNGIAALSLGLIGATIQWSWLPVLLVGSLIGGYTGAHFANLKGNRWIKIAFTSVTLLSGIALLV
ncbi:MAG: UPF0721 transmembrane protein [Micavibrio sp.]|nr:MAG: UPF0721 transmembrane protein [Micavibrio sp.]